MYIYIYNNNAKIEIEEITIEYLISNNIKYEKHSKYIKRKTIIKEKDDNKYLHIFKRHKNDNYIFDNSYCIEF